jgi:hypothetical protein
MDKVINLQLDDPSAWKQPLKETYKNLDFIDILFEILGSVQKLNDIELQIKIHITQDNIFVSHNGSPLDQDDIQRLSKMATHKMKQNRKGVSKQGIGWRGIASVCSNKSFESEDYNAENFFEYSSMISKINSEITIDNTELKPNNLISLIHDNNFQIMFKKGNNLKKTYHEYLKNNYGVLFIIPNSIYLYHNIDRHVTHKLKILFNRLDCQIDYKNNVTDFHRDIFKNKPFYYIDKNIRFHRYLECQCEICTYKNKKILKMDILHHNNILDLDCKISHYFWMETCKTQNDNMKKYNYDDWATEIDDYDKLIPEDQSFKFRMMGFNPDKHQENGNFKKWYNFYTPAGLTHHTHHQLHIEGYGDGIIPYIGDYCLKYTTNEIQKGYLKQPNFHPSKNLLRTGHGGTVVPWKRTIGDRTITYKPKQNFLCELIEDENTDDKKTVIQKNPIKSRSLVCDPPGFQKTIPFFLLWLSHKYIWTTSDEEINVMTTEEELEKQKEETEKQTQLKIIAEKKAEKEEKEKIIAQKQTEKEKRVKLIAQAEKKEEERKKKEAQQKTKIEEEQKLIAQQKAQEEEEQKIIAQQKAQEEEEQKIIAQQKAQEEEEQKLIAEEKAKKEEQEKLIAQQNTEKEKMKKKKVMLNNQKLLEVAQEIEEEKEELEKDIEDKYIPIEEEQNLREGHCYCFSDPTRPKYRKIGKSGKEQLKLEKQYIPRYMPEGITMTQWIPFDNYKLAEDCIFEKLKKYRLKNTEYFIFHDMNENEIDKFINDIFVCYKSFIET